MLPSGYQSVLPLSTPAGVVSWVLDEDGNRKYYNRETLYWSRVDGSPILYGDEERPRRVPFVEDAQEFGGLPHVGGTPEYFDRLGILGVAAGYLEIDVSRHPDMAPYVQVFDGKNFVLNNVWAALRPQNKSLFESVAMMMPLVLAVTMAGVAAAGYGTTIGATEIVAGAGESVVLGGAGADALAAPLLEIPAAYGEALGAAYGEISVSQLATLTGAVQTVAPAVTAASVAREVAQVAKTAAGVIKSGVAAVAAVTGLSGPATPGSAGPGPGVVPDALPADSGAGSLVVGGVAIVAALVLAFFLLRR